MVDRSPRLSTSDLPLLFAFVFFVVQVSNIKLTSYQIKNRPVIDIVCNVLSDYFRSVQLGRSAASDSGVLRIFFFDDPSNARCGVGTNSLRKIWVLGEEGAALLQRFDVRLD
jgi:hypothetical protein